MSAPPDPASPPYSCQMRHVPSLLTMHAPTGASGTHSSPKSAQSVGDAMPAMMSPQMHCRASVDGAPSQSAATSIAKRRRASTCAHSSRSRRLPFGTCAMPRQRPPIGWNTRQSCSCALRLPSARDAARKHVDDRRRAVADQLDQPDERRQDVERLEAGDDDRQVVALDERLEDAPAGDRGGVPGGEEALDARVRHLGDDLHHRRDVLVRRQHREVRRHAGER